ncbi:MAG: Eco57I restriction-modification methylase domain-containing protein [Pirellulales bacterium]
MAKEMTPPQLTNFAAEQQRQFDAITLPQERKERGHFGTPPSIANFMANMVQPFPKGKIRILDPGAGVGTLSAAICRQIADLSEPHDLYFELWENDPKLKPFLQQTMEHCRCSLEEAGHQMQYVIRQDDFVLANTQKTLFTSGPEPTFHVAILNPPYFKVRKGSAQANAMEHVVHGQPNIYVFFMAIAADLLLPNGKMVAITPRSYFNGPYFKRFRKWFFDRMTARQIHIFGSRSDAFQDSKVLQENVILAAQKCRDDAEVTLTSSYGRDLDEVERTHVSYALVIDDSNGDHVIRVTTSALENDIQGILEKLPRRFAASGLSISTGPVVTFRSTEFLRTERKQNTAPLLWMHNVRPLVTQFPEKAGKQGHILISEASKKLLVPASRYVLLKRFTAKEEKRRLVAGIVEASDSYSEWLGLENHVNYLYRLGTNLSSEEAFGIAAYLNSALVDRYFRMISGNTQVNAAEIRALPVPSEEVLNQIGHEVKKTADRSYLTIEKIIGKHLKVPASLLKALCESCQ